MAIIERGLSMMAWGLIREEETLDFLPSASTIVDSTMASVVAESKVDVDGE